MSPIESDSSNLITRDGFVVLVSPCDYGLLNCIQWSTFCAGKKRYARAYVDGARSLIHRFILGLTSGNKSTVDHINGNSLDNRRENLRICSAQENAWNRRVTNSISGYHGVSIRDGRYVVSFKHNNEQVYLGAFDSAIQAAYEYNKRIVELRGEFAVTNNIDKNELLAALINRANIARSELTKLEGDINVINSEC